MSQFLLLPLTHPRRGHLHGKFFRSFRTVLAVSLAILFAFNFALSTFAQRSDGLNDEEERATLHTFEESKSLEAEYVPGEVLVRFRKGAAPAKTVNRVVIPRGVNQREITLDIERFDGSDLVEGLRLARVRPEDTLTAIEALNARPDVFYAEPNYIWRKSDVPNDLRYGEQWALKNTGQVGFNDYTGQQAPGTAGSDIDAEPAWTITKGSSSVVVGVIDGGVDINHEDLRDNIWVNPGETAGDNIDNDGNGFIDDVNGWDFTSCVQTSTAGCGNQTVFDNEDGDDHGTHVAGTIGAKGNNGVGVVGVNWDVRIMSLKVLGPDGGKSSNIIRGYNYARMMRERGINIRVLNNSYGGPGKSLSALDAINQLNQAGILFVAAAGNDATDNFAFPHYPSNYDAPNIIAVAATDRFDQIAKFSNFGARIVSMGAPGRGILSTVPPSMQIPNLPAGTSYAFFSGTSMATPHVTGVAALILSVDPNISLQKWRSAILYSGDSVPSLSTKTITGLRLNAFSALQTAAENDATPPGAISGLSVTGQNGRSVTLSWIASGDDGGVGRAALYNISFIDSVSGAEFPIMSVRPEVSGVSQSVAVNVPYRHPSGTFKFRVFDNGGNEGAPASVGATISDLNAIDPYLVTESSPITLSTGGTPLALNGDDLYREGYALPFPFPFFGQNQTSVTISTNGALYFSTPPKDSSGNGLDAGSAVAFLTSRKMIAGMWDDLRTDRLGGDVFVVTPDANRVIFRWQGSTFANETQPINFEVELRRDGTILTRYGDGNTNLHPVVGISAGEPDAYVAASHTSENSLKHLTNAQVVTFSPRQSAAPPTISINDIVVNEGNLGPTAATYTVSLSAASTQTVTVNFATSDETAKAGVDYQAVTGTLTFAPGENSKSIAVMVYGDTLFEPDESFFVSLSSPTNATIADGVGTAIIRNDDAAPIIPTVLTEQGTVNRAIALDSVTFLRGPFPIIGLFNFSLDQRTRVMLFTSNLGLNPGDNISPMVISVTVDGIRQTVESVGPLPGVNNASYVIMRLDNSTPVGNNLVLVVTLRGVASNTASIDIKAN